MRKLFKAVLRRNETSGENELFVYGETELEEKFIIWFSFEHDIPRLRVNMREALKFPPQNDQETTLRNLTRAFELFKKRYNYVEIPYLVGMSLERAKTELKMLNLEWAIEREIYTDDVPPGHVAAQNPLSGAVASPHGVVYLSVAAKK